MKRKTTIAYISLSGYLVEGKLGLLVIGPTKMVDLETPRRSFDTSFTTNRLNAK